MLDKGKCLQNNERKSAFICMLVIENSALPPGQTDDAWGWDKGVQCMVRVIFG